MPFNGSPMTSDLIKVPSLLHRVWPMAVIVVGLGATVAWGVFLGYGIVELIAMALGSS